MDYIEKLDLQIEDVQEVDTLEKHTIINNDPFSVNKYNGHTREFLALDGDYDDGFKQLKEVDGLGISCIVSKEVKEAREDVNGNVHAKLKDRIDSEVNDLNDKIDSEVNGLNDKIDIEVNEIKTSLDKIMITIEKNTNDIKKLMENNSEPIGWTGKTASFYGDSLTEVNYHYTKGYHQWIKEILELNSYNNYGKSGYTLSNIYSKINEVTDDSDLIIVMGGVNDQTYSIPLGTIDDNTTTTIYGSINLICSILKEKYPSKTILFITPHIQTKYPHNNGITSKEVADAILEVCNKYSIPVYDNFSLGGINIDNLSSYTTDNCHWNDIAHEMVGKKISEFIYSNLKPSDGSTEEPPNTEEPPITEDTPIDGPPFEGAKVTITEKKFADFIHLVALCSKGSNFNIDDTVEFSLKISEPDGIVSVQSAQLFSDDTGELSNNAYTDTITANGETVTNNNEFIGTFIINKNNASEYVKIPLKIYFSKLPSSFKIDNIGIKCNNENIEILKIGTFFVQEQITITKTV